MGEISVIKKNALEHHIPIMKDEGIDFICQYIREHSVKKVLEIGSAVGYSAICFASCAKDVTVVTLERDENLFEQARENIAQMGLENQIEIRNEDALEAEVEGLFDIIFIDAAKSQYQKFFEKYERNLAFDGIIITDNLSFHGMVENPGLTKNRNTKQLVRKIRNYIEFLKNNEEFDTVFYSLGDGISVSKRKSKGEH